LRKAGLDKSSTGFTANAPETRQECLLIHPRSLLLPKKAPAEKFIREWPAFCFHNPVRISSLPNNAASHRKLNLMVSTLTTSEEAQLGQTIEMFEVITQSQPHDYQSLEILKEAYAKLGREDDAVSTSKRIAEAYVAMGQLSSAILEYETILQRFPDDNAVREALLAIENKAGNFPAETPSAQTTFASKSQVAPAGASPVSNGKTTTRPATGEIEDGRKTMHKIFVGSKVITAADFDAHWVKHDFNAPLMGVVEPFVQILADKGILPVEKSLKLLCEYSRFAYLPLNQYDIDIDLARSFSPEICQRWCLLPFDRMSKCVLVATANPFNQQAAKELADATPNRLLWYVVSPVDLIKNVRKAFR
jgi:tetratricopeptide (TPR) repeat protein